jgi:hypothetical protein
LESSQRQMASWGEEAHQKLALRDTRFAGYGPAAARLRPGRQRRGCSQYRDVAEAGSGDLALCGASASWLSPRSARSRGMFLASASRSGPNSRPGKFRELTVLRHQVRAFFPLPLPPWPRPKFQNRSQRASGPAPRRRGHFAPCPYVEGRRLDMSGRRGSPVRRVDRRLALVEGMKPQS